MRFVNYLLALSLASACSPQIFVPPGVVPPIDANVPDDGVREISGALKTVVGYHWGDLPPTSQTLADIQFNWPTAVGFDSAGNVYVSDTRTHLVRKIDIATNMVTTAAGNSEYGALGDGGPATLASLGNITMYSRSSQNALYLIDAYTNRVRKIDLVSGIISAFAGTGGGGLNGNGGPATAATFSQVQTGTSDAAGNFYFADANNHVVRRVAASNGFISTVAGSGVAGYSGDGGAATSARLDTVRSVAVDASNNLYIGDDNHRIRKVDASTGFISTIGGTGSTGCGGDGGAATAAEIGDPRHLEIDGDGNLLITEQPQHVVRKLDLTSGIVSTVAGQCFSSGLTGDGGPATSAQLNNPYSTTRHPTTGDLYIADLLNHVVRVVRRSNGNISTYAGSGYYGYKDGGGDPAQTQLNAPLGLALSTGGELAIADSGNALVFELDLQNSTVTRLGGRPGVTFYSGDGGQATAAGIGRPQAVAIAANGDVIVTQPLSPTARRINHSTGVITRIAGNGSNGYSGNGGAATSAQLGEDLRGLVLDTNGDLYLSDSNNHVVRKIDGTSGVITAVAGSNAQGYSGDGGAATSATLNSPGGLALSGGSLYIADRGNHVVRKVSGGVITTVAGNNSQGFSGDGGSATAAELNSPEGVAIDADGDLLITDSANHRIRSVDSHGDIQTIVGTGTRGYSGDGQLAPAGQINTPTGILVAPDGTIYFSDSGNNVIRKVVP